MGLREENLELHHWSHNQCQEDHLDVMGPTCQDVAPGLGLGYSTAWSVSGGGKEFLTFFEMRQRGWEPQRICRHPHRR